MQKSLNKSLLTCLSLFMGFLVSGCATPSPTERVAKLAHNKNVPISIYDFYNTGPDSAGGVGVHVEFINTSQNTYKYVNLTFSARNKVGDVARSEIGGETFVRTQSIGPFPFGGTNGGAKEYERFGPLWYNNSIKCAVLEEVELVYMDNTVKTLKGDAMKAVVPNGHNMRCM